MRKSYLYLGNRKFYLPTKYIIGAKGILRCAKSQLRETIEQEKGGSFESTFIFFYKVCKSFDIFIMFIKIHYVKLVDATIKDLFRYIPKLKIECKI